MSNENQTLKTDSEREINYNGYSGILVRAVGKDGKWGSFDIAELTRESLIAWLKSHGGDNPHAENTVAVLLGHEQ